MKQCYRMFRRGRVYYCHHNITGKQESLGTKDRAQAVRLLQAKNQSAEQPMLNMQLARVYAMASDPKAADRTWQHVMDEAGETKTGATLEHWNRAMRENSLERIRHTKLLETRFAYGLGYGLGTFLGITIEQRLAFGLQVVSLFTRNGAELAKRLISAGYRMAKVQGHIRDGEASILYVEVPRKLAGKLISDVAAIDETCFCVVNDLRTASFANRSVNPKMSQLQEKFSPSSSN